MSTDYFAVHIDSTTLFSFGVKIENPATTIFIADAKNNIVFFTDDNILYWKPIKGTANPQMFTLYPTIISISLDDMLRIIVIGLANIIRVFAYDNPSELYFITDL
jgi:hypothetical protein